ncbi:hypothetical protein [Streptomyces fradiae]|uniref:hypothetical protein n=1 Tax=Streptomyces fradiae TaxID=1906 RepID=UPI0035121A93
MTDFDSMSHQGMLNWLDQASGFHVRLAAERLSAAAAKMEEIAGQVKNRPGRVEWDGSAEAAFMNWADGLANSTRGLAEYSEYSATRMRDVADAISAAQSAIPRYTSNAQAKENLAAAQKYHNDPDSQTIARNARSQMAPEGADATAIAAKEEANRQAAAAEMKRLSDSYQFAGALMKSKQAPTFPPPPSDFVPPAVTDFRGEDDYANYSTGHKDTGTGDAVTRTAAHPDEARPPTDVGQVTPPDDATGPTRVIRPEVPADMGIDSVTTLPPPTTGPGPTPVGPPSPARPEVGPTPPLTLPTGPPLPPTALGRGGPTVTPPITGNRLPLGPGGRTGPGPTSPLPPIPRDGITGGRVVPPQPGRSATGIPRSTVIGNEGPVNQRGPVGRATGAPMGQGPMSGAQQGQSGVTGGRRLASEQGGVVGGRPQQPGAAGGRPYTPGGSGLVREGGPAGRRGDTGGPAATGRGGIMSGATPAGAGRQDENDRERPDYLVEDEETWQQGSRRAAPPVID